eukprot:TRINITY_DN15273_c0_g1_i2.p1 TRINITY_DN15273_c0_g1~~TRINITY_DN15273_c0_g1_i2.p1  ORF type:complete len:249 (-),score=36.09 TRINITY_DN15273_c0_g1_i2:301-1047(-)
MCIRDSRDTILEELNALLEHSAIGRQWGVWAGPGYTPPCFTRLSRKQVEEHMTTSVTDPTTPHLWTLFGLVLAGTDVAQGKRECPRTHEICRKIPGLVNAGFSCLGPRAETGWHQDVDRGFDRVHLSLVVPPGDCVFQVMDQTRRWAEEDVIVFDDTKRHNAYNQTELPRYVLLVDILRSQPRKNAIRRCRQVLKDGAQGTHKPPTPANAVSDGDTRVAKGGGSRGSEGECCQGEEVLGGGDLTIGQA